MEAVVLIAGLISFCAGFFLRFKSRRHRTEAGRSIRWYQVKYWFQPGRAVETLTTRGMKLHLTSLVLILLAVVLLVIVTGLPPLL